MSVPPREGRARHKRSSRIIGEAQVQHIREDEGGTKQVRHTKAQEEVGG